MDLGLGEARRRFHLGVQPQELSEGLAEDEPTVLKNLQGLALVFLLGDPERGDFDGQARDEQARQNAHEHLPELPPPDQSTSRSAQTRDDVCELFHSGSERGEGRLRGHRIRWGRLNAARASDPTTNHSHFQSKPLIE